MAAVEGQHPASGGEGSENTENTANEPTGNEGSKAGKENLLQQAAAAQSEADGADDRGAGQAGEDGRPAWCADQFWNAETKSVNNEALHKSWQDTRAALKRAKAEAKREGTFPEEADGYTLSEEVAAKVGKPVDGKPDSLAIFRDIAHKAGLSNEQFGQVVEQFMVATESLVAGEAPDPETERQSLGPNADKIVGFLVRRADRFVADGAWTKEEREAFLGNNGDATSIRALYKLFRHLDGENSIPTELIGGTGRRSPQELYAAIGDPRYESDAGYRAQVDREMREVFGDEPAASSLPNLGVDDAVAKSRQRSQGAK